MGRTVFLDGLRTKSVIDLPFSGAEVELWDYALVGDISGSVRMVGNVPEIDDPLKPVLSMIVSWSFVDAENKPLEINAENLKKLPAPDFLVIAKKVEEATRKGSLTAEEKKSTVASST